MGSHDSVEVRRPQVLGKAMAPDVQINVDIKVMSKSIRDGDQWRLATVERARDELRQFNGINRRISDLV